MEAIISNGIKTLKYPESLPEEIHDDIYKFLYILRNIGLNLNRYNLSKRNFKIFSKRVLSDVFTLREFTYGQAALISVCSELELIEINNQMLINLTTLIYMYDGEMNKLSLYKNINPDIKLIIRSIYCIKIFMILIYGNSTGDKTRKFYQLMLQYNDILCDEFDFDYRKCFEYIELIILELHKKKLFKGPHIHYSVDNNWLNCGISGLIFILLSDLTITDPEISHGVFRLLRTLNSIDHDFHSEFETFYSNSFEDLRELCFSIDETTFYNIMSNEN